MRENYKLQLTDARIRALAVIVGGAYQDDETGEWSFGTSELVRFVRACIAESGFKGVLE